MRRSKPGDIRNYRSPKLKQVVDEGLKVLEETYQASKELVVPTHHGRLSYTGGPGSGSLKTPSCIEEIIERIARGETINSICKDEHMPSSSTVWSWIRRDPNFANAYYEAKKFQMNAFAEQIIEISDNSVGDIKDAFDKYGNPVKEVSYENIKRSELRVKARQWLMERLMPSKYSERVTVDGASNNPNQSNFTVQIMLPDNGRPVRKTIEAKVVKNGDS